MASQGVQGEMKKGFENRTRRCTVALHNYGDKHVQEQADGQQ